MESCYKVCLHLYWSPQETTERKCSRQLPKISIYKALNLPLVVCLQLGNTCRLLNFINVREEKHSQKLKATTENYQKKNVSLKR